MRENWRMRAGKEADRNKTAVAGASGGGRMCTLEGPGKGVRDGNGNEETVAGGDRIERGVCGAGLGG